MQSSLKTLENIDSLLVVGLKISQAVKDVRGKILLDAQQDVLEWAQRGIVPHDHIKKKSKIKEMAQLMDDCQSIFEAEPYNKVLSGWTNDFREWVGELWAPSVIFEELKIHRMRDPYAYRHVLVVAVVGARMLELWIKTAPTVRKAFQAFLCHDIGKSRISPVILESSQTLTDMERKAVYEHPAYSFVLNSAYWGDCNHLCAEVALHHNEDRLGKGYPRGVKTNSLILDILGLLDRFDALISDRPFRVKKFTVREALDLLKQDADEGKLEADVLRALVALVRQEKITDLKKIKLGTIGRPEKA